MLVTVLGLGFVLEVCRDPIATSIIAWHRGECLQSKVQTKKYCSPRYIAAMR